MKPPLYLIPEKDQKDFEKWLNDMSQEEYVRTTRDAWRACLVLVMVFGPPSFYLFYLILT